MDRGAWWATIHWGHRESDKTEQLSTIKQIVFFYFASILLRTPFTSNVSSIFRTVLLHKPNIYRRKIYIKKSIHWIRKLLYIYTMEYYSAIKKNSFESDLVRWMKLEPIMQSEVNQKDKELYSILTHIYGI